MEEHGGTMYGHRASYTFVTQADEKVLFLGIVVSLVTTIVSADAKVLCTVQSLAPELF